MSTPSVFSKIFARDVTRGRDAVVLSHESIAQCPDLSGSLTQNLLMTFSVEES